MTEAVAAGAKLELGGHTPEGPGFYYPPTVLTGVSSDAEILHTEIFGPVAPIVTFTTEEEAVELANNTEYGLVSYVYTADLARGLRVSERIEAGMVGLNRGLVSDPAAPSAGSRKAASAAKAGSKGSSPSPRASTSPSTGDSDDNQWHYVLTKRQNAARPKGLINEDCQHQACSGCCRVADGVARRVSLQRRRRTATDRHRRAAAAVAATPATRSP